MKMLFIVLVLLQILTFSWETYSLSHLRSKRNRKNRGNRGKNINNYDYNNPKPHIDPMVNPNDIYANRLLPQQSPTVRSKKIPNGSYNY